MNDLNMPRSQAEAFGLAPSDHWIVCSGLKVISDLLPTKDAAIARAAHHIRIGDKNISVHHVGDGISGQWLV